MEAKRDITFDLMKGIAILAMLCGHCVIPNFFFYLHPVNSFINSKFLASFYIYVAHAVILYGFWLFLSS